MSAVRTARTRRSDRAPNPSAAPASPRPHPSGGRSDHGPAGAPHSDDGRRDHAEVLAFLSAGTRTGKLGWVAADGRPLVAPAWFVVEDGALLFNTGRDTAKGWAVARDPRLTICVDSEVPYGFVQVQGIAETNEDAAELLRSATAIGAATWDRTGPRSSGSADFMQGERRAR